MKLRYCAYCGHRIDHMAVCRKGLYFHGKCALDIDMAPKEGEPDSVKGPITRKKFDEIKILPPKGETEY